MYRPPIRFWAAVALFASLNSLGIAWIHHDLTTKYRPRLRVASALPVADVDASDRFTLVFDEPVVEADALGQPLSRSPFTVEPRPDGHWEWVARDRLEYLLARPLPPGRVFRIHPDAELEARTGRRLVGQADFQFQTRAMEVRSCTIDSEDRTHANIELRFNQPVRPDDLLKRLTLRDPDAKTSIEPACLTRETGDRILLRAEKGKAQRLELRVEAGLVGPAAELGLRSAQNWTLTLNSVFALLNASVETPRLEKDVRVSLRFTRELAADQPTPDVTLEPAVPGLRVRLSSSNLRLEGPFACGTRYTATVAATTLAAGGATLPEAQRVTFEIPNRDPCLRFSLDRGILSPRGNLSVDLEAANIRGLTLSATRVYANNLVAHLRGDEPNATSRDVLTRTIPLDLKRNEPRKLALDLKGLLGEPLGIYRVEASDPDERWTNDTNIVTVTDLALTAKRERGGLFVWVTSLRTAQPVPGVTVSALSYANQTLATSRTNSLGVARLPAGPRHPDGEPWVITAALDGDLAYLELDRKPWVLDDCDQTGRRVPETYDVLLYAERGVYRPGDTIHLTGIIRDANGETPPAFPLELTVCRPDGRSVARLPTKPADGEQGVFHLDYASLPTARTGRYRFMVALPGSAECLGDTTALVEEFAPVRIELTAQPTQERFGPGEPPTIDAKARYLFGLSAAGLPVEITTTYRRISFRSKRFADFAFGQPAPAAPLTQEPLNATLDDKGEARVTLKSPPADAPGLWEGRLTTTVTEPGGRSVSDSASMHIDTAGRYIGLRMTVGTIVPVGKPVPIEFVQVTGDDQIAAPGPVDIKLDRIEYDNALQKVDDHYVWKTTERATEVLKLAVGADRPADEPGTFSIQCPESGEYRLTALDHLSRTTTQLRFYATDDDREALSLALNRPERLESGIL